MASVEPRFAMDHPVQFRLNRSGTWWNGRTRNLSRSGMLFSSQVCLEVGTVMEIRLLNDDADGNVLVVGPILFSESRSPRVDGLAGSINLGCSQIFGVWIFTSIGR